MRILKVVQAYYPFQDQGGPVVKVRALARGLMKRGHHVTVLTADLGLRNGKEPGFPIEPFEGGWRAQPDDVDTFYLKTIGHYRAITLNPGVLAFCRGHLKRFDIVHFYGLYDLFGPAVSYFCRRQGLPYVIEPMGMYRPIDRSFHLKRLWHRALGNHIFKNAAQIVVTSEMEYQDLLDQGVPAGQLVIRYNGVDTDLCSTPAPPGAFRAKWKIPPGQPLILFLSRLIPRKGADLLIAAFAQALPQSGRLAIVGPEAEPGYRKYLEQCAKDSHADGRVLFTGPLYDEEKRSALVDADLFVLPSRYENFANVAAESIAVGVPVIVTRFCGIHSLVDGKAGLVIAPDKQELIDALQKMLHDKGLYSRLREGCRGVAAQLNWEHLCAQMEGYYADALVHSRPAH